MQLERKHSAIVALPCRTIFIFWLCRVRKLAVISWAKISLLISLKLAQRCMLSMAWFSVSWSSALSCLPIVTEAYRRVTFELSRCLYSLTYPMQCVYHWISPKPNFVRKKTFFTHFCFSYSAKQVTVCGFNYIDSSSIKSSNNSETASLAGVQPNCCLIVLKTIVSRMSSSCECYCFHSSSRCSHPRINSSSSSSNGHLSVSNASLSPSRNAVSLL